jgi:hypothetical protein
LNPQQGLCVTVSYLNGGPQACQWQYEFSPIFMPVVGAYWSSCNNGYWFMPVTNCAGMMDIYGTVP